jgi:prepilin-type N-terminal cleavage/methylation domain-containing protein
MIKKGFTMIELLVVIAIIGILASLALISFSGSQKQARDSQRKSDLKQYQNALELFANQNNGLYPSRTDISGASASTTLCDDLAISTCPEDPRNADDASFIYKYQSNGTGAGAADATSYVLWGKLENVSTTTYWVLCSTGVVGKVTSGIPPTGGVCPL